MQVSRRVIGTLACLIFLVAATAANASEWRNDQLGPTFADMVKDSPNVVFAQVTNVSRSTLRVSVAKAVKGGVRDEINITGFARRKHNAIKDLRKEFKPGDDVFFFLNAAMIGSVPFEPTPNSVHLKIHRGKLKTSIIVPVMEKYHHELDYEIFSDYLSGIVAIQKKQAIEPTFLGQLMETVEAQAANPKSTTAATHLQMLLHLLPDYDKKAVLFAMLEHEDLNSRVLALQHLANVASSIRDKQAAAAKEKKEPASKKKKRKKSKRTGKKKSAKSEEQRYYNEIFNRIVQVLKTEKSRLMQSTAAMALSNIQDPKAISKLADRIDSTDEIRVETCEMSPISRLVPPTRRAVLTAIVTFEQEDALDVLERELLKNKVETFRMILEIFRDYADPSLNLLLFDLLQDANFLPRQVAILEYFRSIKDEETIQGMKDLFLSPDAGSEFIRKSIVEVFASFNEPKQTAAFLIKYGLHDRSAVVRQATARALGVLGDPACVEEFKNIYFKESNRLAREFYVEALSKIRSRKAFETLKWLKTKENDRRMIKQINFALKKSRYLSQ